MYPQMLIGAGGDHPALGSAFDKTDLEQKWLDHLFDRARIFMQQRGDGG